MPHPTAEPRLCKASVRSSIRAAAFVAAFTTVAGASLSACAGQSGPPEAADSEATAPSALAGAWDALEYRLAGGAAHPLRGQIFFTDSDWTVLFFVLDDSGEPRRGSAEGGTYTLTGDQLVFTHLYNFSQGAEMEGLPAADLRMTARSGDGPTEPSRITRSGEDLTIHFPSGNEMVFRRSS